MCAPITLDKVCECVSLLNPDRWMPLHSFARLSVTAAAVDAAAASSAANRGIEGGSSGIEERGGDQKAKKALPPCLSSHALLP